MFESCFSEGVRTPNVNLYAADLRELRAGPRTLSRRTIKKLNDVVKMSLTSETCSPTQRYIPGICMPGKNAKMITH